MRKLFLMLAMLAAPAQARTVTATVYDPGTTVALITAAAPTSTGASARRTHGPAVRHPCPRHPRQPVAGGADH
jgi:hypothetical protein